MAERFRQDVRPGGDVRAVRLKSGFRPDNAVLTLPFLLAEDAGLDRGRSAAREMALANAAGAAHFLLQDDELDGEAVPAPSRATTSDLCLMLFVRTYASLTEHSPGLWQHVDRYLGEYAEALVWERAVLRTQEGRRAVDAAQLPLTLRRLGRRLSMLKTTCAAVALLAGSGEWLGAAEEAVERFHAGYQLADDLDDLERDLEAGHWTVPAWLAAQEVGVDTPGELDGESIRGIVVETGVQNRVLELANAEYVAARDAAAVDGLSRTAAFFGSVGRRSAIGSARRTRRALLSAVVGGGSGAGRATGEEASPPCGDSDRSFHAFSFRGDSFLYDSLSGLLLEVDAAAADAYASGGGAPALEAARLNYGDAASEAAREIARLRVFSDSRSDDRSWPPDIGAATLSPLTALSLHLTTACNLRCSYCYLARDPRPSSMSSHTARRAVDLLMSESFGSDHVSLVFFGGEPLLEPALVLDTAAYARERSDALGRRLSLHVTTNGTLLSCDLAQQLRDEGIEVMVSLDGDAATQDMTRPYPDGGGSYDDVAANISALPNGMRVGARATITPQSGPLEDVVSHLVGVGCAYVHLAPASGIELSRDFADRLVSGFQTLATQERAALANGGRMRVGNFAEAMAVLDRDAPRLAPCGAGTRYYSVQVDGTIVTCHRFAGCPERVVGDVARGIDRGASHRQLRELKSLASGCGKCWARFLCGGPCLHDALSCPGRAPGDGSQWCRVTRRVLELSMWVYAGVPAEHRERALRRARASVIPEHDGAHAPERQPGLRTASPRAKKERR